MPECGGGPEPSLVGDFLDRQSCRLQQILCLPHSQGGNPVERTGTGGLGKPAIEGAFAHSDLLRELLYGDWIAQFALNPFQEMRKPGIALLSDRLVDELRLPTLAVRRHDESPSYLVCREPPKILTDNVKTQVDSRRAACRGENVALVNIKDVRLQNDGGERLTQLLDVSPVGGGTPAMQESRCGQNEDA